MSGTFYDDNDHADSQRVESSFGPTVSGQLLYNHPPTVIFFAFL